jgi:hypothetical protein
MSIEDAEEMVVWIVTELCVCTETVLIRLIESLRVVPALGEIRESKLIVTVWDSDYSGAACGQVLVADSGETGDSEIEFWEWGAPGLGSGGFAI